MDELDKILYKDYSNWKQWTEESADDEKHEVYIKEISKIPAKSIHSILEIGFGSGDFMAWCTSKGYQIEGVEVSLDMLEKARNQGYSVYDSVAATKKSYDLIVAFDVLEHISRDKVFNFLQSINASLKAGGYFMARFPNGASPFGRIWQHGDLTHRLSLNCISASQLASLVNMELISCGNSSRTIKSGKKRHLWLFKYLAYAFRNIVEIAIGYIYFGSRVPLDPNLTVIMKTK